MSRIGHDLRTGPLRPIVDFVGYPMTYVAARWLRFVRTGSNGTMPYSERACDAAGILPVLDHYYEPLVIPKKHLRKSLREPRELPGIDWNDAEQLALLRQFDYEAELWEFPLKKRDELEYGYDCTSYSAGDAEILYSMVRHFKPRRVVEVGGGNSTLLMRAALRKNDGETGSRSEHICIEPYEQPWLEKCGAKVVRQRLEDVDRELFDSLEANDILFIDSSHIIRPQGDVLTEFLDVIPQLKPGVVVHVHDIFSPRDYLDEWVLQMRRLWNEQYLLEAFLAFNSRFRIVGALNYLAHQYPQEFNAKAPIYAKHGGPEPRAFWMVRNA